MYVSVGTKHSSNCLSADCVLMKSEWEEKERLIVGISTKITVTTLLLTQFLLLFIVGDYFDLF